MEQALTVLMVAGAFALVSFGFAAIINALKD